MHSCIHNDINPIPLSALPETHVLLHSPGHEISFESSATYTSSSRDVVPNSLRNLKFHLIFLFNESCHEEGAVVPTYMGSGTVRCAKDDILTHNKREFVTSSANRAVQRLSSSLLTPPASSLRVPANSCSIESLNEDFEVKDADFVLFVTAVPLVEAGQTLAWGRPCVREGSSSRPVVGIINFVLSRIPENDHVLDQSVAIAMHEVSHALGFINLYSTLSSYIDKDGVRQQSGGTATVYRPGLQKEVKIVKTPRVLEAARHHFGCDTLDGVEIEDMGGSGTAGSHWKKRIFYEEALVGVTTSASLYYSSVTLAFFEDAGFYKANYDYAEDNYKWGYHRGCDFLLQTCRYLYDNKLATEFCFQESSSSHTICTHDHQSAGHCDVTSYSAPLPAPYQYYSDTRKGGSLDTMDYCPAVLYYNNYNCINPYSVPLVNLYGDEFGLTSRCFESNVISHTIPLLKDSARCFKSACVTTNGKQQIVMSVQGRTQPCLGSEKTRADTSGLRGLHGFIECPSTTDFCPFDSTPDSQAITQSIPADLPQFDETSYLDYSSRSCTDREAHCSSLKSSDNRYFCSSLIQTLRNCFGIECISSLKSWLHTQFKIDERNCWSRITTVVERCMDGWEGANSVCRLAAS